MNNWLRKLRGVAGLTAIGGLAGALFGSLWAVATTLFLGVGGISATMVATIAAPWTLIGATSAAGVAVLLATFDSKKTLGELSPLRTGLWGGLLGALGPLLLVTAIAPGLPAAMLVGVMITGSVLGSGIGGGLVAAAKGAEADQLTDGSRRGHLDVSDADR